MPSPPRRPQEARRGDRLNAQTINRYIRDAITAATATEDGGTAIFQEPAFTVPIVNVGTVAIGARQPVSLEASAEQTGQTILLRRGFQVRTLGNATVGVVTAAIACRTIPVGGAGRAYVSGVCAARMTDAEIALLPAGGGALIWSEAAADSTGARWAVVRLGGIPQPGTMRIIGGNLFNGFDCILYAAVAPTITSFLDPDTTTSFSTGFGRAWLMDARGTQLRRVLVWHDFGGWPSPMPVNFPVQIRDTTTLTVASGADIGRTMTFYRFTFPI